MGIFGSEEYVVAVSANLDDALGTFAGSVYVFHDDPFLGWFEAA